MEAFDLNNKELIHIIRLFFDDLPSKIERIDTSHGEKDFRETVIAEWSLGKRYVLKMADNGFTFAEKISVWQRCGKEYRKCGYYCPAILSSKSGDFPTVLYQGHKCVVYAEEYSRYRPVENRVNSKSEGSETVEKCRKEAFLMTAVMAAKHFDFSDYPSGYCLFERFCPSDETDEVTENALAWKKVADALPTAFRGQVQRIWQRWVDNKNTLEEIYHTLPTSVFQADLNPTNLLIDDDGEFRGIYDFNLCGRDVFLNYIFREIWWIENEDDELRYILDTLKNAASVYPFTEEEKKAAILLYRCIKPLWFTEVEKLKQAENDRDAISKCLNDTEAKQTREIDFESYMD